MIHAPDVLHVGFSKCASTFLQAFFKQHPEVFLVLKSHYFTPFEHCDFDKPVHQYLALFRPADPQQITLESDEHIILPDHHPVLESAATTLDSVIEVCRRIKSVNPNARILLVIRNQVDLIASRYSEYLLAGGKLEFREFVEEFLSCSLDGNNYYQNYYSRILGILREQFGADNVLLILQEDFRREEAQTIDHICKFLRIIDIDATVDTPRSRRAALSLTGMRIFRRLNKTLVIRPARSYRNAEVHGPYALYKTLQVVLRIFDYLLPRRLKGDKAVLLEPDIVAFIRDRFAEDNAMLSEMLGRDLAQLGY